MNDSHFWLSLWLGLALIGAATIVLVVYFNTSKDYKMAQAGYVQKLVVTGNPNDTYTRNISIIWVPKNEAKAKVEGDVYANP
jgi:hypothetical protein